MMNRAKSPIAKDSKETRVIKKDFAFMVDQSSKKNNFKSSKFVPKDNFLRPIGYNIYGRDFNNDKYSPNSKLSTRHY